jgi:hypothetical protein
MCTQIGDLGATARLTSKKLATTKPHAKDPQQQHSKEEGSMLKEVGSKNLEKMWIVVNCHCLVWSFPLVAQQQ